MRLDARTACSWASLAQLELRVRFHPVPNQHDFRGLGGNVHVLHDADPVESVSASQLTCVTRSLTVLQEGRGRDYCAAGVARRRARPGDHRRASSGPLEETAYMVADLLKTKQKKREQLSARMLGDAC